MFLKNVSVKHLLSMYYVHTFILGAKKKQLSFQKEKQTYK